MDEDLKKKLQKLEDDLHEIKQTIRSVQFAVNGLGESTFNNLNALQERLYKKFDELKGGGSENKDD